jgi:DNA-binding SARP family transcriptional activator
LIESIAPPFESSTTLAARGNEPVTIEQPAEEARVEFGILGPLELRHAGRSIRVAGAKERALLAVLLLHANEAVHADRLIDDLWSGRPPATARKSLQVRIAGLRRVLPDGVLLTEGPGYVIRTAGDELDLHRFERLVAEGRGALDGERPGDAAALLREALALWRGPALTDFRFESFAQPAIARLEELRVSAIELRIDAELALGRHDEAVAELEELAIEHPLRERLRAQLMLALYRAGRQADALDVYRQTRELLVSELGIEPGPALRELERRILDQEASLDGPQAEPERSILVALRDEEPGLLELAAALATRPPREVILARVVEEREDVTVAAKRVDEHRQALTSAGLAARSVAFTSVDPGADLVRLALEQDVDLAVVDGDPTLQGSPDVEGLLLRAPCDVAVRVGRNRRLADGAVLVLFAGGDHDWAAAEIGAWLALARGTTLRIAGPEEGRDRDSSRVLASASLALQRVFGLAVEPVLLRPAEEEVLAAVADSAIGVVGLPERWRRDGLGRIRGALAAEAESPVLLVRRGLRPGGLAPRASLTRFTWTLAGP